MREVGCGGPSDESTLSHSDSGLNKNIRGLHLTRYNSWFIIEVELLASLIPHAPLL